MSCGCSQGSRLIAWLTSHRQYTANGLSRLVRIDAADASTAANDTVGSIQIEPLTICHTIKYFSCGVPSMGTSKVGMCSIKHSAEVGSRQNNSPRARRVRRHHQTEVVYLAVCIQKSPLVIHLQFSGAIPRSWNASGPNAGRLILRVSRAAGDESN